MELFADLQLCDYLIRKDIAQKITFHGKYFPWFVSDVTENDLDYTLNFLGSIQNCRATTERWKSYIQESRWLFQFDPFWNTPIAYWHLKESAIHLWNQFSKSSLVIWKGDLNFRKLVYDGKWNITTDLLEAFGKEIPTNYLVLRTLKSDTAAGIQHKDKILDSDWMVSGKYATIQFVSVK